MNLENPPAPEPDGSLDGLWSSSARRVDGEIAIGGVGMSELATEYGTPLYVLDEDVLRARARAWKGAMDEASSRLRGADVYYAGKAFLCVAAAKAVTHERSAVDACPEGEPHTVLAAGVPGNRIRMHGNNKPHEEIKLALRTEVGHFIVDSLAKLEFVDSIARNEGVVASVTFRMTTGVHADGHEYMPTAVKDQKFGLSITSGAAWQAVEKTVNTPNLRLLGLHSHIDSQILAVEAFEETTRVVLDLRARIHREIGLELREVDFSGGYSIRCTGGDPAPPSPAQLAGALMPVAASYSTESGIEPPRVSIEPGRNIVGPAGVTLYAVGTVKTVELGDGPHRYVSVDSGMSDDIRPVLHDAVYTAALASREGKGHARSRVVSKHCESGDIVVRDVSLPEDLAAGDIPAVPTTGAYGRSMASNYNHVPRPGVVTVRSGASCWIVRRETVEDPLALDADYLRRGKD